MWLCLRRLSDAVPGNVLCCAWLSLQMLLMRNLSVALSACIYQCLCDSDSVAVSAADMATSSYSVGAEGYTSTNVLYKDSHLMAGIMQQKRRHRHNSSVVPDVPNSLPAKWPGMHALPTLPLLVLFLWWCGIGFAFALVHVCLPVRVACEFNSSLTAI